MFLYEHFVAVSTSCKDVSCIERVRAEERSAVLHNKVDGKLELALFILCHVLPPTLRHDHRQQQQQQAPALSASFSYSSS
jgi:hypothetical protein